MINDIKTKLKINSFDTVEAKRFNKTYKSTVRLVIRKGELIDIKFNSNVFNSVVANDLSKVLKDGIIHVATYDYSYFNTTLYEIYPGEVYEYHCKIVYYPFAKYANGEIEKFYNLISIKDILNWGYLSKVEVNINDVERLVNEEIDPDTWFALKSELDKLDYQPTVDDIITMYNTVKITRRI